MKNYQEITIKMKIRMDAYKVYKEKMIGIRPRIDDMRTDRRLIEAEERKMNEARY